MGQSNKKKRARHKKSGDSTSRRRYFRVGVVLVALLMLFGGAILFAPADQVDTPVDFIPEVLGAPRVAVAQEMVDFGDVKLDRTVEAVFRVRNVGDQVLEILDDEPPVELKDGC